MFTLYVYTYIIQIEGGGEREREIYIYIKRERERAGERKVDASCKKKCIHAGAGLCIHQCIPLLPCVEMETHLPACVHLVICLSLSYLLAALSLFGNTAS